MKTMHITATALITDNSCEMVTVDGHQGHGADFASARADLIKTLVGAGYTGTAEITATTATLYPFTGCESLPVAVCITASPLREGVGGPTNPWSMTIVGGQCADLEGVTVRSATYDGCAFALVIAARGLLGNVNIDLVSVATKRLPLI